MLKIGDFSKLTHVSIRMLRHYDEIGLLIPDKIDDATNYRYYSAAKLTVANRISALKNMGFSLATISEIMSQYDDAGKLKAYLQVKLAEVCEQSNLIQTRINLLETTIQRLGKDITAMKFDVILKEIPQRYVASVRGIISDYNAEGELWATMMQETAHMNLSYTTPCYSTAIFYDEGYKESDVDVEIQMSVAGEYTDTANVAFKTVAPIQVASVTFKGSYGDIAEANESVANWITDSRYDFAGAMFNIYHVSPDQDPNPENWVTEVCYPVLKK